MYEASYKANPPPTAPSRVDMEAGIPTSPPPGMPHHQGGGGGGGSSSLQRVFAHMVPEQQHPKKKKSNRLYIIGGAALVTILLCVIVGVVVFHLAPAHKPIPAPVESNMITNCVSCTVLETALQKAGKTINIAELDVKMQDDDKLLCCLKTTARSDTFLEMLLEDARQSAAFAQTQDLEEDKSQEDADPRALPPNIVPPHSISTTQATLKLKRNLAAALVGLENRIPSSVPDNQLYVLKEWGTRTRYPVTFIRREIKYTSDDGHFKMPRDGLYIINVHLGLSNVNKSSIEFGQRLFRSNPHFPNTAPEELAFDSEKIPKGEQRTSSLSSVFNLRRDDEIFVQVAPAHAVVERSSMSYLSVFLLSE